MTKRAGCTFALALCASLAFGVAAEEAREGRIAFHSTRGGDRDVYDTREDGPDVRNLTNDPSNDRLPAWSPDGRLPAVDVLGATRVPVFVWLFLWVGEGRWRLPRKDSRSRANRSNRKLQCPVPEGC